MESSIIENNNEQMVLHSRSMKLTYWSDNFSQSSMKPGLLIKTFVSQQQYKIKNNIRKGGNWFAFIKDKSGLILNGRKRNLG